MAARGAATGEIGERAERLAERYIAARGLAVVARNYRCRAGEIDLVAMDADTLVFVEVRYRASAGHGGPAESITPNKQRRVRLAAEHFLQRHDHLPYRYCRFDVVCILGRAAPTEVEWIEDAFQ